MKVATSRHFLVRMMRWSGIVAATLFVLWAVFCVGERWRWKRAWDSYRSAAIARGVKLEVDSTPPPAIPDEENFAAIPMIRAIYSDRQQGVTSPEWFDELKITEYRRPPAKATVRRRMT